MSCAINKLNLACSSHIKILRFPIFLEKKIFATGNGGGGGEVLIRETFSRCNIY